MVFMVIVQNYIWVIIMTTISIAKMAEAVVVEFRRLALFMDR
jgi:hypothetical protein